MTTSMQPNIILANWKSQRPTVKNAASTAVDKEALEKAFMDQAYGHVANRAGDLFQDPHRLGFEIVFSNAANTRMVGLYAFRLSDRLLYAPVFFLSGEIKGYDLAYRHWVKKFCPLTPEWMRFLLDGINDQVGNSVSREMVGSITSNVHLDRLANPPQYQKSAALADPEANTKMAAWTAGWGEIMDEMEAQKGLPQPILGGFFKTAGWEAMDKMAALLDSLPEEVMEKLVKNAAPGTFDFPDLAPAEPELAVKFVNAPDAAAHAHLCQHGYFMTDKRAAKMTEVVEDLGNCATGILGPGVYRMLMRGGEFRRVFAAPFSYEKDLSDSDCPPCGLNEYLCDQRIAIVDLDSKHSMNWDKPADVLVMEDPLKDGEDKVGEKLPKAGKAYRVFCPKTGVLSSPFVCDSVDKGSDGVKLIRYTRSNYSGEPVTLVYNPDCMSPDLRENIVNDKALFIEVAFKKDDNWTEYPSTDAAPGRQAEFEQWITAHGGKVVSVKKSSEFYSVSTSGRNWNDLTRKEAHMLLASMRIGADVAGEWLDTPGKRWTFPKEAYATQLVREPDFRTSSDGVFGIEVESPYREELPTRTQQVEHPAARIGDAHDPGMGNGPTARQDSLSHDLVLSSAPEMLAQMATQSRVPHVLEHGAIGSLSRTYDSLALVESYIPPMEECLDRLGRCLFLYYWKPQDFEKAYGTDDMSTQENDFLNAFRMLGDLVLSLLRRSRGPTKSQGSPVQ